MLPRLAQVPFLNPDSSKTATATADEIDVQCRLVGLPGIADGVRGSGLFAAIVEADEPELIRCPTVRAAIAFKWKAYGQRE